MNIKIFKIFFIAFIADIFSKKTKLSLIKRMFIVFLCLIFNNEINKRNIK